MPRDIYRLRSNTSRCKRLNFPFISLMLRYALIVVKLNRTGGLPSGNKKEADSQIQPHCQNGIPRLEKYNLRPWRRDPSRNRQRVSGTRYSERHCLKCSLYLFCLNTQQNMSTFRPPHGSPCGGHFCNSGLLYHPLFMVMRAPGLGLWSALLRGPSG